MQVLLDLSQLKRTIELGTLVCFLLILGIVRFV